MKPAFELPAMRHWSRPCWGDGNVAGELRGGNAGIVLVGLSEIDRNLLDRCLDRKPRAWEDFVDRFMGLVVHVVRHTAQSRSLRLGPEDRDDLVAEVFLTLIKNDFAVLRHFRGASSLATYLAVVARRVVVKQLLGRKTPTTLAEEAARGTLVIDTLSPEQEISTREEVAQAMASLDGQEADVVRMYHLESKSYHEIGQATGIPENSIGPILSRARTKMRRTSASGSAAYSIPAPGGPAGDRAGP